MRRAIETLLSADLVERSEAVRFPFEESIRLTRFGKLVTSAPLINWPSLFFEHGIAQGPRVLAIGAPRRMVPIQEDWGINRAWPSMEAQIHRRARTQEPLENPEGLGIARNRRLVRRVKPDPYLPFDEEASCVA